MVDPVTWDILDQPWDSLSGWSVSGTTSSISPAGQLYQIEADNSSFTRVSKAQSFPDSDMTIEARMIINNATTGQDVFVPGNEDYMFYRFLIKPAVGNTRNFNIFITERQIALSQAAGVFTSHPVEINNVWFIVRWVYDFTANSVDMYFRYNDTDPWVQLASSFGIFTSGTAADIADLRCQKNANLVNTEVHHDYLRIATGKFDPTELKVNIKA